MLTTLYVRYRQIRYLCINEEVAKKVRNLNNVSFSIACVCVLGMLVVANFQETNALIIHVIGANLCFGGAVIWEIIQVYKTNYNNFHFFFKRDHLY